MPVQTKQRTRTTDIVTILDQYKREHDTVSFRRTRSAVKALSAFFKGKRTTQIDILLCRQYIAFRMGKGVTMSTAARELTTLRAACNHGKKWGRIKDIPQFEIPTDLPRREVWLLKDEIRTLIENSDPDMEAFIRLCYGTGSRKRAIETIEWDQVSFTRGTIDLAKRNEPKTNKRRPTVPMGNLRSLLAELYETRENGYVLGSDKDRAYEFRKLCRDCELLNVSERDGRPAGKITPHVLRHSRATHLLEDGASIYAVARLLGDAPTTVQATYGHICMSSLEDELTKSTL